MSKKIVLTGTHITPALALIEKLKKNSYQVHYLGKEASFDKKLITQENVTFTAIKTPKLNRHQIFRSILKTPQFVTSFSKALKTLREVKPDIVLSFGGFVALPVCLASRVLKIKLIIHEQTLKAGLTNKLTAPLANKVAISWPQSQRYFKKSKTILTGNPVRSQLLKIKPKHKQKVKNIYITGGSQGSRVINQTTLKILNTLLENYTVVHQFGLAQTQDSWHQALNFKKKLPKNLQKKYILKHWFTAKELNNILSQTDLMISRSGINTITEALLLKTKAVLIPLPFTQKNEQLNNAKFLKSHGLATILDQNNLEPKTLLKAIDFAIKNLPQKSNLKNYDHQIKKATDNLFKLVK